MASTDPVGIAGAHREIGANRIDLHHRRSLSSQEVAIYMVDWLLHQMPEMLARYDYMRSLLDWLEEWFEDLKADKPAFPWVMPHPLLIASLERAAQDCKSVAILRFLVEVQKQIAALERVNRESDNDALAVQTLMSLSDDMPKLEKELKGQLLRSGIMARLFFFVLLFLLFGTGLYAWISIGKAVFGD
ncbi:MAG: hypothetical protein M3128_03525 [Verrucomicrobiota bacterium]|nr:hypothetical protein [Verrucomicrobiota bacterium]